MATIAANDPSGIIEPDDNITDIDSTFAGSSTNGSYNTSIASSIMNYRFENGRRYHAYREGEYLIPNDDAEQDRMDLVHHIYELLFKGKLYQAPIGPNPQRVLDLGTGTGIWAIDFADQNPSAEVIGNDLSAIQPGWVPPNCRFEIDDFEGEWDYSQGFDFIHGRELEGAVSDYDKLFKRALQNLRPGGFLEMQSIEMKFQSDNGTHEKSQSCLQLNSLALKAAEQFGKGLLNVWTYEEKMKDAGFQGVTHLVFKLPLAPWPKDPHLKEVGRFQQVHMIEGIEAYAMALFTRVLGWSKEETQVLLAKSRTELKDPSIHMYTNIHVVYGQKDPKA